MRVLLVMALLLTGCQAAPDPAAQYGGSPEVYARIARTTDCTALQAEFDTAGDANDRAVPGTDAHRWSLGYMTAADDRMEALGCT